MRTSSNGWIKHGTYLNGLFAAVFAVGAVLGSIDAKAASGTGLKGDYFSYRDLTHFEFSRTDAQVNFNWGTSGPSTATGYDTFGVRWSGSIEVPVSQTYTFYTYSDDGVRLYVNGKRLVNNWTDHAPTENKGSIYLQAGRRYNIKLEYYENVGQSVIQLFWSSPQLAKQIIPQLYLYPVAASSPVPSPAPAPSPSPTPVPSTPTPTPAPAPTTGYVRPFSPTAAWNIPVAGLPVDPYSSSLVTTLWDGASGDRPGNWNINNNESFAVYDARTATGSYQINIQWGGALNGAKIPWNPNWKIPAGTDRKVIILDPPTGREWNIFETTFNGTTVNSTNGSLVPGSYFTSIGENYPSRGVGIAYLAMLVRPEEIEAGVIRHALAQSINNTDGDRYVAPAIKLEHPNNPAGVPEGTRFALRVTDAEIDAWVATLPSGMRRAGKIIAVALRDYGWFITDTAGYGSFEFEDAASASARWQAVGMGTQTANYKEYPRDLLDGLLKPERIYAIVPSDRYP